MLNFGNKEFRNLQEQVLKNAQDIETLKGREDLQIVIVNELPEVGNPNYIYLVAKDDGESPDIYDEYIWLEDEERYEKIGGVTIDLSNYVTLDSEQSITGSKTFLSDTGLFIQSKESANSKWSLKTNDYLLYFIGSNGENAGYLDFNNFNTRNVRPITTDYYDIGTTSKSYKDLYLSGKLFLKPSDTTKYIRWNSNDGQMEIVSSIFISGSLKTGTHTPISNSYDLGSTSRFWKNLYLTGNISDGVNTVSVANIASKATSTFVYGTFDANGESTIDTEQAGTPEGLFIFTYGNCQCFLRLTATMIQNADTAPIRVACPMIYNSGTVNGWLNITKSGYILILKITDGTNHVDSGYAWTLTKTNLI